MKRILGPTYVVCEGPTDSAFVRAMAQSAGLTGFVVGDPTDSQSGHGQSAIPRHLRGALAGSDAGNIRSLAVFLDNNSSPDEAAALGKEALANCGYVVPDPPAILVTSRKVGLYVIPGPGVPGTLEDLLLDAVLDAKPHLRDCLNVSVFSTMGPLLFRSIPPQGPDRVTH